MSIITYYGINDKDPDYTGIDYNAVDPATIPNDEISERVEYLKEIFQFEESRQSTIENKISQIIGQSGVVFSLAGLFIPLLFDKLNEISTWQKVILIGLFLIALMFYLWSILKATQSFQINKYKYATGNPETVLNTGNGEAFKREMIKDLIYSCKVSEVSNNHKASKLLYANNAFKSGSITMGLILLLFCLFVFNYSPKSEISNTRITNLDSTFKRSELYILHHIDSVQKLNTNEINATLKDINASIKNKDMVIEIGNGKKNNH